jgi:RHS repeat-associated protein
VLIFASTFVAAQSSYLNAAGNPSFSVNFPVENGFINLANGNLHLEFPLATHKQRGALSLNERLVYDSRIWMITANAGYAWLPGNVPNANAQAGWRFVTGAETGTMSITMAYPGTPSGCAQPIGGQSVTNSYNVSWSDPSGTVRDFGAAKTVIQDDCNGVYSESIAGNYALDTSGYHLKDDGYGNPIVLDGTGAQVYPQVIDRFGNYWSTDGNGNLIDDLGRTPVIVTKNGNVTYYDVLAPNGTINNNAVRVRYTVTSAPIQVQTNFQQSGVTCEWPCAGGTGTLTPVQNIQLPDGGSFAFTYDSYGEITSVTLPTGGTIHYGWTNFQDSYQNKNRWLTSRTVGSDPATTFTPSVITQCSSNGTGCKEKVVVHKPSGDETAYELTLNAIGAWNTNVAVYTGSASGNPLLTTANTYSFECPGCNYAYTAKSLSVTTLSSGFQTQQQYIYDSPWMGKPTKVKEWDYYTGSPSSTPTRETDYLYSGFDLQQVTVLGNGVQAAQTTYGYTSSATTTSGVTQHGTANAGGPYLQTVTQWLNTGTSSVTTYAMDDTGMVTSVRDPNQNTASTISYQCANAFPYQTVNPLGHATTYGYDCNSGAITSLKDPNDAAANRAGTTYQYEATAGRLQSISYPDGGQATYSYPSSTEVDASVTASPNPTISSQTIADSLGRPYQQVQGGISTETSYDSSGRPYCTTNPHFTSSSSSTDGSTCITSYDGLDRPLIQMQPDGSTLNWSYSGNVVTSTDEENKSWQRTSNAFGQLTKVIEPGNLQTAYAYDGLGNLQNVVQSGTSTEIPRSRSFAYDSLSRLTKMTSPESGITCYGTGSNCTNGYDANGNLKVKTDARGVTTTYNYDGLNRLVSKTYSDSTPSACFQYDQGSTNGLGNLSSEWTQAGACTSNGPSSSAITKRLITQYDPAGRATVEQQCPWGGCSNTNAPTLQYGFDAVGHRISFTDVANTTLSSSYDNAGRLTTLASSLWDGNHPQLVFAADSYGPMGLVKSRLGGGHYEVRSYTNRGWLQSYSASHASNNQTASAIVGYVDIVRNHEDGGNAVPQNGFIDVIGWAYNTAGCPLGGVEIDLDSVSIGMAGMNGSRPDVQQNLGGGSQYANCGWGFTGSIGAASPGTHTIKVYGIDANGNRGLLSNQFTISVSANTPPVGAEDGAVSIQDGTQNVLSGGQIYAYGWAIDSQMRAPVGAVKVLVDGTPIGFATLGGDRPDIAASMNDQRYLHSGWNFVGTVGNLSPGSHTVSSEIYDTGGTKIAPQTPRQITVVADPNTIAGSFAITIPTGGPTFRLGDSLSVSGWTLESNYAACATITRVEIWIDSKLQGAAQLGIARQDVANAYQNQNCLNSGWSYSGTITGVDPGPHLVFVRAYDHSGGSIQLQQTPLITVSGNMLPSSVTNPLATQYAFSLGYDPNGNVAYSSDSVNGTWAYLYDGLNRLSAAGSAYQTSFAWDYDSFGNMWSQVVTGGSGFGSEKSFGTGSNRSDQVCYDAAGNQLADWGCNGSGPEQYAYDAEGRLSAANWGSTTYIYDAEGRRVAKQSGGQTTYFFFDNEGHQVADMDGAGSVLRRQIYAGDRNLATYDDQQHTTIYALSDWLGTQRARSDMTGSLCQTTINQPFGDGQQVNGTCAPSNNAFTGLERDQETGLDHATFRQYSSTMGRWMSPDPYNGSMDINYPQTFNRYAYVMNRPLSLTDPSGLDPFTISVLAYCGGASGACAASFSNPVTAVIAGGIFVGAVIADLFTGGFFAHPTFHGSLKPRPNSQNNGQQPDKKACSTQLAQGVQNNTGTSISNVQYTGTIGGHANYTFDVGDPSGFQGILNQNPAWPLPFGLDQGSRYGLIDSTHIENTLTGGFSGHTDLFNGHSFLAPLHWLVDVGIGHIPGVNLDFGCKAGL